MDGWAMSPLDRDQPAGRVLALVLEDHLEEFRNRAELVRDGDDAEDLHRYRVVLRRSRSLLSAGRSVYPAEELELLSAMTAHLATLTSPVRDLDVLLDHLDARVDRVTPRLRAGVPALRDQLKAERTRARESLLADMGGEFAEVLMRRWQVMASVYRVGGTDSGPDARRPAGDVVDAMILASFKRLRRQGRRARGSTTDADWHRLRKRVKRFRYLLSAFEDLYEPGTFDRVLKELADLQDGLGELQDRVAEAGHLVAAGEVVGGSGALLAGALVDHLDADAPGARRRCRKAWDRFERPKVRRHLREALGG